MAVEAGRSYRLEVGTALATALTVTAISKASEAVVTASNTLVAGDWVLFGSVDGMAELSFILARVKSPSGTQFTLEGIDSTNWGTWTAGTCQKVNTWSTLATATSVDFGAGSVDSLDATTLLDVTRISQAGLIALPDVTVQLFTDYSVAVQTTIDTNAYAGTVTPFRFTKASGHKRALSGIPSTIGESVSVNQLITGQFTIIRRSTRDVKYLT
jgi:hypothetical protein